MIDDNTLSIILREPIGVVGQIVPWNFPFCMKKICDIQDLDIIVIDGNVPIIEQNELKATGVKVAVAY